MFDLGINEHMSDISWAVFVTFLPTLTYTQIFSEDIQIIHRSMLIH